MDLDGPIDRLNMALAAGGVGPPRGVGEAEVQEIEEAITPLRLPVQLVQFWERVGVSPQHPLYADTRTFPKHPRFWPAHWQRASGISPEDLEPHGATHTIAELLTTDPSTELRATISGEVVGLAAQRDTRARVSDGTGELDVHCPATITAFGPVVGKHFEFDVIVSPGRRRLPSESVIAARNPDDPVEALVETLSRKNPLGPATAVATAVRSSERRI